MAFDLEEQEKIDQVRAWWDRFGGLVTGLLTAILLVLVAYYAWGWYKNYQAEKALGYYETIYTTTKSSRPTDSDKVRIQEALSVLQNDYTSTAYPARASLIAANYFVSKNDLEAAQKAMQWVVTNGKEPEIVPVAQLQLSAILMDQGKLDEALSYVSGSVPESFKALFLDRQGDIQMAKGQKEEAVKSWKTALNEKGLEPSFSTFMQNKIKVLGGE
ncbi:tetratricopeptide repeat protein [Pelistega sp. MC2]|uniref:YfgM family protein n=1 Tax=Pelistega sp. MC2 TaxID=1720297 RepID=UPI0008D9D873|nr:tetratricopeptide repeat protein [Pelistega sp. MC2]